MSYLKTFDLTRLNHSIPDYKTDAVIQRTLRTEIAPDVTVITIAHRLQTIMDVDRIVSLIGLEGENFTNQSV